MIKCTLDEDECIDLQTVLRVINQINQEQAWAVCYEVGTLMRRLTAAKCAPIDSLAQIQLHKNGFVHEKTCLLTQQQQQQQQHQQRHHHQTPSSPSSSPSPAPQLSTRTPSPSADSTTSSTTNNNATNLSSPQHHHHHHQQQQQQQQQQHRQQQQPPAAPPPPPAPPTPPITPELNEVLRRRPALNESELVASLGIALFWALDYGIPDDEERKLSITMEYLIIQSQTKLSLDEILELCIDRLPVATKAHADSHYREVCKSLISDTFELSIFLEKIYTASMVLSDIALEDCLEAKHKCDISDDDLSELGEPLASLRALRINDWARLWMQVIRELRQRGKFKQQQQQQSSCGDDCGVRGC